MSRATPTNSPNAEELAGLAQRLVAEREQSLYGRRSERLVQILKAHRGLGDGLAGVVESTTAHLVNRLLNDLVALGAEDLMPVLDWTGKINDDSTSVPGYASRRHRPELEGLFARTERCARNDRDGHSRSLSSDNVLSIVKRTQPLSGGRYSLSPRSASARAGHRTRLDGEGSARRNQATGSRARPIGGS